MAKVNTHKSPTTFYLVMVILLVLVLIVLCFRLVFVATGNGQALSEAEPKIPQTVDSDEEDSTYLQAFRIVLPIVYGMSIGDQYSSTGQLSLMLAPIRNMFGDDLSNPRAIIASQIPVIQSIDQPDPLDIQEKNEPARPVSRSRDTGLDFDDRGELTNENQGMEEIDIDVSDLEADKDNIKLHGEGAKILVYHTHTTEAYKSEGKYEYVATDYFRTDDPQYNITRVGREMVNQLKNKYGIEAIHDTTVHDIPYSGAYKRSLKTIEKNMKENKALQVVIDIHRNGYGDKKPSIKKDLAIINGQRVARVMIVIATGEGEFSSGYDQKPNWKENYKFALKIKDKMDEMYPGLFSKINISRQRYNQHVSDKAILVEIGSELNTMDEALISARYLADVLAEILE
ncbi:MAG: stage II sporulation protein P [Mahellales bacterium]|jgi:stage II sporulation protein P